MADRIVVYTAQQSFKLTEYRFRLVDWCEDDLIEYLLARHPEQCASVMARFSQDPRKEMLAGAPPLYCLIADLLAADPTLSDIHEALRAEIGQMFPEFTSSDAAGHWAIAMLLGEREVAEVRLTEIKQHIVTQNVLRLLRYRSVQIVLAANRLVRTVKQQLMTSFPSSTLPRDLVEETARLSAADADAMHGLRRLINICSHSCAPMVASALHFADPTWRPNRRRTPDLHGALFTNSEWPGINLQRVNLEGVDLRRSNLAGARLELSQLNFTVFGGCDLEGALLRHVWATHADFGNAKLCLAELRDGNFEHACFDSGDLSRVNARGAQFKEASFNGALLQEGNFERCNFNGAIFDECNLSGANLSNATLRGVSFRTAKLHGTKFDGADLHGCDLEGAAIADAWFQGAKLTDATLTASRIPKGNFNGAALCGARLADIDWPFADLRDADLSGCTFHFGSSRSGLVGSPIASHGSRTSFYTDDFGDQAYKAPEEIRKANLYGADLRGARLGDTDFYLVDLRGAQFDAEQAAHFRRCDAILRDCTA